MTGTDAFNITLLIIILLAILAVLLLGYIEDRKANKLRIEELKRDRKRIARFEKSLSELRSINND